MARTRLSSSTRRRRGVAILSVLATGLAMGGLVAQSASAAPPPPPTSLRVVVATNVDDVPQTSGTPALLVEALKDVPVTVTLLDDAGQPVVASKSRDTVVRITTPSGGPGLVGGSGQVVVPGDSSSGTGTVRLAATGNDVTMSGLVVGGVKTVLGLTGTSSSFDVIRAPRLVTPANPSGAVLVNSEGLEGAECTATPTEPTCFDLYLPNGLTGGAFFAKGACDANAGCASSKQLGLVLADFAATHSNASPATLVVKCDKTLCPGGGVSSYGLQVSLDGDGPLPATNAPACSSKGVIQSGEEFCVDYVQSKRDGSGDTYLYLLLTRDVRPSCC